MQRSSDGGATYGTIVGPDAAYDLGQKAYLVKSGLRTDSAGCLVRAGFYLNFSGATNHWATSI